MEKNNFTESRIWGLSAKGEGLPRASQIWLSAKWLHHLNVSAQPRKPRKVNRFGRSPAAAAARHAQPRALPPPLRPSQPAPSCSVPPSRQESRSPPPPPHARRSRLHRTLRQVFVGHPTGMPTPFSSLYAL